MNIPKQFKIGNIVYSVRFEQPEDMNKVAQDNAPERTIGTAFGRIDYATCEIVLNPTLPNQRKAEVLLHEIIHGLFWESGLDDINIEPTVDAMTHILRRFMIDNEIGWVRG